jgi:uncharacterized membrane protein
VVVGQSYGAQGSQAIRWTRANGLVGLGILPGGKDSGARGVSADGNTIVGHSSMWDSERNEITGWWAFAWTAQSNIYSLGVGSAVKANRDGTVIVGDSGAQSRPYRWSLLGGGGPLTGITGVDVHGVSGDGSKVVGYDLGHGYVWTAGGITELPPLPGDLFTEANGISASGEYVVGVTYDSLSQPFRWSASGGMLGLGNLPEAYAGRANSVSSNGAVVVGMSGPQAFVWDTTHGMRNLREVLIKNCHLELAEWTLTDATSVSGDGRTMVGFGVHHLPETGDVMEGWVAQVGDLTIPELSIVATNNQRWLLSWPGNDTNAWLVQVALNPAGPWTNQVVVPIKGNGQIHAVVAPATSEAYFRLSNP